MVGSGISALGLLLLMQGSVGEGTDEAIRGLWAGPSEGCGQGHHVGCHTVSQHHSFSPTDANGIQGFFYPWSKQEPKFWGPRKGPQVKTVGCVRERLGVDHWI